MSSLTCIVGRRAGTELHIDKEKPVDDTTSKVKTKRTRAKALKKSAVIVVSSEDEENIDTQEDGRELSPL
jgi:hypothetical protein